MSEAFRPSARLRHRGEFTVVQSRGRRVSGRFLTLLGHPNTVGHDRLGIIASKRVGNAIARNRAKRRLREVFRRAGAPAAPSLDLVAVARTGLTTAPFTAVAADFQAALGKLRGAR